jgi:hypothetical protein
MRDLVYERLEREQRERERVTVQTYAKFFVAIAAAAIYAVQAAISDGTITNTEWNGIIATVLSAAAVYLVPNKNPDGTHYRQP